MKAFDDFLLWQEVVYYVVATALGYSHYNIVAVIIIALLVYYVVAFSYPWLVIVVHGRTDVRTEPAYKNSRLRRCKKSKQVGRPSLL